ncbi:hypothetical protein [Deinococcus seoulensis]|nr:hypothetical protein [Deinococcus seoulensis]
MSDFLGEAARQAIAHPNNSPRALLAWLFPDADLSGLNAHGVGVIRSPLRADDEHPSLSCGRARDGMALLRDHGGAQDSFNAISLVAQVLGIPNGQAVQLLIERAGVIEQLTAPLPLRQNALRRAPRSSPGVTLRAAQSKRSGEERRDALTALDGWEIVEIEEDSPQREMLLQRGLLLAVHLQLLSAYRFTGRARTPGGEPRRIALPRKVQADAIGFVVSDPHGEAAGVKFRNPGAKEELKRQGLDRYHIPGGQGLHAWCSPTLLSPDVTHEVWVEGELNGIAIATAVHVAGLEHIAVQGLAGTSGKPWVLHDLSSRNVFIYTDPDKAGEKARQRWEGVAHDLGATVYRLPPLQTGQPEYDAAAFLESQVTPDQPLDPSGALALAEWLTRQVDEGTSQAVVEASSHEAVRQEPSDLSWGEGLRCGSYAIADGCIVQFKAVEGQETARLLMGFTARIMEEVLRDDGSDHPTRSYLIKGWSRTGQPFAPIHVPVEQFPAMTWIHQWGLDAFMAPGGHVKDHARAAIQLLSQAVGARRSTTYLHTGWLVVEPHGPVYLTADACIGAGGAVDSLDVHLEAKLAFFALPAPPEGEELRAAVRASLDLLTLGPLHVTVPMLGLTYRAPLGPVNFTLWLNGTTGWAKSALAAIYQTHFGPEWHSGNFPGSWSSTANALTTVAYSAKDVLFVIDDFKPEGSADIAKTAQAQASSILSAVGNQAGRSRLSADGVTVRTGPYPRGSVLSTAESTPRKLSDVARTVTVDLTGSLLSKENRPDASEAFDAAARKGAQGVYARATSGFVRWIAQHYAELTGEALRRRVRATSRGFAAPHNRTPDNLAELAEGWRAFLSFARSIDAVKAYEADRLWRQVHRALRNLAATQAQHLEATDPTVRFLELLGMAFRTQKAYVEDGHHGGAPAEDAETLGWERYSSEHGDTVTPGRHAEKVGYWMRIDNQPFLCLEPEAVYRVVNKIADGSGHALPSPKALWSSLKAALSPKGAIICEKDRALHYRQVYNAPDRVRLLHVKWPLPDLERDERDAGEETGVETTETFVPFCFSSNGTK